MRIDPAGPGQAEETAPAAPPALVRDLQNQVALIYDDEGRLVHATPEFEALVGYDSADHVSQMPPHPWWPPEDVDGMRQITWFVASGAAQRMGITASALRLRRCDGLLLSGIAEYSHTEDPRTGAYLHVARFRMDSPLRDPETRRLLESIYSMCWQISTALARSGLATDGREDSEIARERARAALSEREREVLDALLVGQRAPEIARALSISRHTARNHVHAVYRKLSVHSHVELMRRLGTQS